MTATTTTNTETTMTDPTTAENELLARVTATWYRPAQYGVSSVEPVAVIEADDHTALIVDRAPYGGGKVERRILRSERPLYETEDEAWGAIIERQERNLREASQLVSRAIEALEAIRRERPDHPAFAENREIGEAAAASLASVA